MYLGGRISRLFIGVAVFIGIISVGAFAMNRPVSAVTGINEKLNFQGRLYNAQGAIVPDGNYNIQFKIYQDGAGTAAGNPGGTLLWTENWLNSGSHGVQIKNGYLSVELGTVNAFGSSIDWNQDTLWLSMNIGNTSSCTISTSFTADCGGDGEMVPMKRMSSSPYALNSGKLGGLTSAQFLQLAQGVQADASINTTSVYLNKTGGGNFLQLQSSGTDVFTLSNSGNIAFGANSDHTISVATAGAGTGGNDLTVSAGTGGSGTGSTGGDLVLQGGTAGGTNGNGGNVTINAGAKTGSGTDGSVSIGTSNTSSIYLGANTVISAGKSLTLTGGNTASRPASPTEGMVYYDTTTKQLLTYANGKWQADRSTSTKIVAASNSSQAVKDAADYVADGTGDQAEINTALTAAAGGAVYLAQGTFSANATISIPNDTTLSGAGQGTIVQLADIDTTDNLIENSDTSTGAGVTIRDLSLDGQNTLQTGTIDQHGIYLDGMGSTGGRQGAYLTGLTVSNFEDDGIYLTATSNSTVMGSTFRGNGDDGLSLSLNTSSYNTITNNLAQANTDAGFSLSGAIHNTLSNNTSQNNSVSGIELVSSANHNSLNGNTVRGNTTNAVVVSSSNRNSIVGNNLRGSSTYGIHLNTTSAGNTISSNNIYDMGGATTNNAIYLDAADDNSITANTINDGSATTNNYGINVFNSTSDTNYLSDNRLLSSATINDAGTGTIYGGQLNGSGAYTVQASGGINLQNNTSVTGSLTASTSVLTPTVDTASAGTLSIGTTNATAITLAKSTTVTGNLTVTNAGNVAFERGSDFSTTGTSNNVNFGTGALFRLTGASAQTITGIAGGVNGRIITLVNAAAQAATISNNSGSSSAGNKIITGSGSDISLVAGSSLSLVYDSGDSVWRVVGASGSSASYIELQASTPGTAQTGNFNITGTGIAATLQGGTSVLTPLLDTASAGTLNIGTTNATGINLNQNTVIAAGKSLRLTGGNTASRPASPSAGMLYYDTDTNQMLTYNGTKWKADGAEAVLVAANDSSAAEKAAADYIADGTADESEINSALTAADPAGSGRKTGKVYLFAGTYTISSDISMPNNTTLAGAGRGTLLSLAATASSVSVIKNTDTSTGTGITVRDLRINGSAGTGGTQYGIALTSMGGGTGSSARQGATIRNVIVLSFRTANVYLTGSSNGTFSSISSQASLGAGFSLNSSSNHNTFTGNRAQGNTGAGFSISSSSYNNFTGNNTEGNTSDGFTLSSAVSNTLSGNVARTNGGNGITLTGSSTYTTVTGNTLNNNTGDGINAGSTSTGSSFSGNTAYNSGSDGYEINAPHSVITNNTAVSSGATGFTVSSGNYITLTGNNSRSNTTYGIYLNGTTNANVSSNVVSSNSSYGIFLNASDDNVVGSNRVGDNAGTSNNAIYLTSSDRNSVVNNTITDSSVAGGNVAITISNSTSDNNYLAGNTLGSGSISNSGTGTIFGGQLSSTNTYDIQASGGINLQSNTSVTGTLSATTSLQAPLLDTASATALNIGTTNATSINLNKDTNLVGNLTLDSGANRTISIGTSAASTAGRQLTVAAGTGGSGTGSVGGDLVLQGGAAGGTNANGGNIYLDAGAKTGSGTDGSIYLGSTRASTIQIGSTTLASGTQTVNIGTNNTAGSTTNVTVGSGGSATGGITTLQAKDSVAIATNGTARATFNNTNTVYFGNGVTAAAPNSFTISGTGSSTTAVAGGALTVQGGNATVGNANGGNLTLSGGTGTGTGVNGLVVLSTPTFQTVTNDANCYTGGSLVASSCSIAASSVNNSAAVLVGFSASGQTATMPDPTTTTAGRVVYVTAANGSSDFTLSVNGGGTGNTIAMRQNTTATMIWNGSDWTAAGASSSTTLQSAYDNTLTSAGGAELLVSNGTNANGLTIRDSSTNPVNGTLLEVQNSSAANLFSVNSNVTEYASNAGAETAGASSSTFPASTWTLLSGATLSRYTTIGNYVATGQASVSVATNTTAGSGVKNQLSSALTASNTYNVSFTTRLLSGTFTDLEVYYSIDGSAASTACTTGKSAATSVWTKVNCTFTAPSSGITSSNAIFIRQTNSGTSRTFYVDNLSVTIAADQNFATDGTVNDNTNFATNWSFVNATSGAGSVTRNTSDGYEASDSASVTLTTGAANAGIRNKLSVNPLTNKLYRVTVYGKLSSGSFTDFKIRYAPTGSTGSSGTYVDCVDYNTQTLTTSGWTKVTCYIQTDATTPTTPYVNFVETASNARTFMVDAFSMTLATASTPNVQVGGGVNGGPTTLFTLDKGSAPPIASDNEALLGSMYYDTSLGKLQCYEADGWGACGSSPDTVVTISPEYTNAVLHGTGIGTMTSDLCSDTLNINDGSSGQSTICGTNETYNFYKWTSPQSSAQTYSIYVTYQLPSNFKDFTSGSTSLMGRTDSANSTVNYQVYKSNSSGLTACGSTVSVSTGSQSTWQTGAASGSADPTTCSFSGSESIVFKINVTASSNANAYVGNLNFTYSNR